MYSGTSFIHLSFWGFYFVLLDFSLLQDPYQVESFKWEGRCSWAFSCQLKKSWKLTSSSFSALSYFNVQFSIESKQKPPQWSCWKSAFHESTVHVCNVQIFPFEPSSQLDPHSPSIWCVIVVLCGLYCAEVKGTWPMWEIRNNTGDGWYFSWRCTSVRSQVYLY